MRYPWTDWRYHRNIPLCQKPIDRHIGHHVARHARRGHHHAAKPHPLCRHIRICACCAADYLRLGAGVVARSRIPSIQNASLALHHAGACYCDRRDNNLLAATRCRNDIHSHRRNSDDRIVDQRAIYRNGSLQQQQSHCLILNRRRIYSIIVSATSSIGNSDESIVMS